jgi:hypothetical protein
MVSDRDCEFYREFGSKARTVVELGCWLGKSTFHLTHQRSLALPPVHVFDTFIWCSYSASFASLKEYPVNLVPGDSFLEDFLSIAEAHRFRNKIIVHSVDVCFARWDGPPIDLLIVDAAKSLASLNAIMREFIPRMSKHGIVFFQDFKCVSEYHIALRLAPHVTHLTIVHETDNGVAFMIPHGTVFDDGNLPPASFIRAWRDRDGLAQVIDYAVLTPVETLRRFGNAFAYRSSARTVIGEYRKTDVHYSLPCIETSLVTTAKLGHRSECVAFRSLPADIQQLLLSVS